MQEIKSKYAYTESKGQTTTKDTLVIPNEAMTVRQMLVKNSNGTLYDNFKTPYYEEQATFSSTPLNVIQNMDEMEKLDYLNTVTKNATELKTLIQQSLDEQQKAIESKELGGTEKPAATNA